MVAAANDPLSGQPELKATPARVEPIAFGYRGFALTRRPVAALPDGTWFARVAVAGGAGLLFATDQPPAVWRALAGRILPVDAELAEYLDAPRGVIRIAAFRACRFDGCLFVGPAHAPPQWDVVRARFESGALAEHERRILLSGRSGDGMAETGPLICACFGVKLSAIHEVMAAGVVSVADIGRVLRAGTNCGSCLPELRGIIERGVKPTNPLAIK
jgi:assimilatory nitrate reductase catalytic subunit